ncbi:MAG TPA: SIS domain-containing protein [Mycobacteriales bacterium]|nr:SIS domain-containing protein [Mycobacteriales bacterium]
MSSTLDESLLDDETRLAEVDRGGLLRAVATAGAQVRESLALAEEAGLAAALAGVRPRAVLVAVDPDADDVAVLLSALADRPDAAAPVVRQDGPVLPVWAGPVDVLLTASASPIATATPALVESAARRGLTVLGTGPEDSLLHEACGRNRAAFVPLPAGRHPRANLWAPLVPLLLAAGELGLMPAPGQDLRGCADLLDALAERCRPGSQTYGNPAKSLALDVAESVPVLIGSTPAGGAAARRLAGNLAASGRLAAWGTLPVAPSRLAGMLAEPAGADALEDDLFRDRVDEVAPARPRLVLIRAGEEADHVRGQVDELVAGCGRSGVPVTEVMAEEAVGPVGRLASVLALLDFTAAYVGLAAGSSDEEDS